MKTFEEYDNFYTLLHKRRVMTTDPGNPGDKTKWRIRHVYKIIYGHFMDNDENIFEYKTVFNRKIQFDDMTRKCDLSALQQPNSNEPYYKFFTYEEIYNIKQYYVKNAKLEQYKEAYLIDVVETGTLSSNP